MEAFIIYLIGFLICYVYIKKRVREKHNNDWSDVIFTFCISLFSYLGWLVMIIFILKEDKRKPPKFL